MLLQYIPALAIAEDLSQIGLCEHHPRHEDCGYIAAVAGSDCSHKHGDDCYQVECAHIHGECGYVAAVEGVDCDHQHDSTCGYEADEVCSHVHGDCSYVEAKAETPCSHDCAAEEACGEKLLTCSHIHDDLCGYVAAVEGAACDFVCQECGAKVIEESQSEESKEGMGSVTDGNIGAGTPDGNPPVMKEITLSTDTITVPGEIEVIMDAEDDVSGVEGAYLYFRCDSTGKQLSCGLQAWEWDDTYENRVPYPDGKLHGTLHLDQYVESGTFVIDRIEIYDLADNSDWFYRDSSYDPLPEFAQNISFQVVDTAVPDSTPPVLNGVTLSVDTITVPGTIDVTMEATDAVSGLSWGYINFKCATTGKNLSCHLEREYWDEATGKWYPYPDGKLHGTLVLDQYVEDGVFTVYKVELSDAAANKSFYYADSTSSPLPDTVKDVSFTVVDTQVPDSTPPVLKNVSLSVKKVDAPGRVEVLVDAEDNVSGLDSGSVFFTCDATEKTISSYVRAWEWDDTYENRIPYPDGKLHGTLELSQYIETGTFVVNKVKLVDEADNTSWYYQGSYDGPLPDPVKAVELYVFNTVPDVSTSVSKPDFVDAIKNAPDESYIAADYSGNATMPKEAFNAIAGTDKTIDLVSEGITWRFEGSDITEEIKDIDLNVDIQKVEDTSGSSGEAIEENLNGNPGIVMKFPENGTLPGKATIQIKVDYAMREYLGSETGLYVYYYNNQTGELELIQGDLKVVNDTYVEFTITHCSYYVLTTALPGGKCGDEVFWEFDGTKGLLTISGSGDMMDFASGPNRPWADFADQIMAVKIENGITRVGTAAFQNATNVTSVSMPSTVRSIGNYAFAGCRGITEIRFREGLESIGEFAFQNCTGLTEIDIPDSVTNDLRCAFVGCEKLDFVFLGAGMTAVGSRAFDGCKEIHQLELPNTLTAIGDYAFRGCTDLYGPGVPEGVTSIGNGAFYGASTMSFIGLPDTLKTLGDEVFANCSDLYEVELPAGIESFGNGVFSGCDALNRLIFKGPAPTFAAQNTATSTQGTFADVETTVYYPAGYPGWDSAVTGNYGGTVVWESFDLPLSGTCGENAEWSFDKDTGTLYITGSGSVHGDQYWSGVIHAGIMDKCQPWYYIQEKILYVEIAEGITEIGDCTFHDCRNLQTVKIPSTVTVIDGAFEWCTALQSVEFPAGLTKIGANSFYYCKSLEEVVIPKGVTEISERAFTNCHKLASVSLPNTLISIGEYAFSGCYALQEIELPEMLTQIGEGAFNCCLGLTAVKIPQNVTEIKERVFGGCESLRKVTLSDSIREIGDSAFYGTQLSSIEIPAGVTMIGENAFYLCNLLREIRFLGDAPQIGQNVFYNVMATAFVPEKNATWTNKVMQQYGGEILWFIPGEVMSGECGGFTWRFDDSIGELTLSGDGWSMGILPWLSWKDHIKSVVVKDGFTLIPGELFEGCTALTSVSLPVSLERISDNAFSGCSRLSSITIPGNLMSIGKEAFSGCTDLKTIHFDGRAPFINENAFAGVTAEAAYSVNESSWLKERMQNYGGKITWVSYGVPKPGPCGPGLTWEFDQDTGTLIISGKGNAILSYSLEDPAPWSSFGAEIKSITFAGNIDKIGDYAFANCTGLTSVVLPGEESLSLGEGVFFGCTNLKEVKFTGRLYTSAEKIFKGVTAEVYYPSGYSWNASHFKDYGGKLTWIEYGEDAVMLSFYSAYLKVGETYTSTVEAHPAKALADCTFAVSDPKILKIVSHDQKSVTYEGLTPGRTTVTVTDKNTGLTVSKEVLVFDSREISLPYTERILVDKEPFVRSYIVTPTETAKYVLMMTDINAPGWDSSGIDVFCDGDYVEPLSWYWGEGVIRRIVELTAGKTYELRAASLHPELGAEVTLEFRKAETAITSIALGVDTVSAEVSKENLTWVGMMTYPLDAYADRSDIQWSIKDTDIAEIVRSTEIECGFRAKKPGTTEITVSLNGFTDTATIHVYDIPVLHLGETLELKNYAGNLYGIRSVKFIPEQDGRYIFTVTSDGIRAPDISYPSASGDVYYGYGDNYCTLSVKLKAGEPFTVQLYRSPYVGTQTITVNKAANTVKNMKVLCTCNTPDRVEFSAQFDPVTAAENVVKWEVSNPKLLGHSRGDGTPHRNQAYYTPYGVGKVTVTATSESGLTASCAIMVGQCQNGHDYSGFVPILDGAGVATGTEYRTCSRCDVIEERSVRPAPDFPVENTVILDKTELGAQSSVWIDGKEYPVEQNSDGCYIKLPENTDASTMISYGYHTGDPNDVHTQYPVSMKVWALKKQADGSYVAIRVEALDDILQYSGSSIRVTGNKGIRMITSVNQDKKNTMVSGSLAGYKLLEYGTVLSWAKDLEGGNPLVLGQPYAKSNYAFKKGVADPVFAYTGDLVQYTNVLVGFTNDQCKDDIAMRSYMILKDEDGETVTIYGGIVYRSIGYIAYQNRAAFAPGTGAYEYVWEIIRHVYGDQYDAEYKG